MKQPAGDLRHRISIEAVTTSQDEYGELVEQGWSSVAQRWAKIEPLSVRESITAQQLSSEITHKVTLRTYSGLTTQHRLKYGSRIFSIVGFLPDETYAETQVCTCVEGV